MTIDKRAEGQTRKARTLLRRTRACRFPRGACLSRQAQGQQCTGQTSVCLQEEQGRTDVGQGQPQGGQRQGRGQDVIQTDHLLSFGRQAEQEKVTTANGTQLRHARMPVGADIELTGVQYPRGDADGPHLHVVCRVC